MSNLIVIHPNNMSMNYSALNLAFHQSKVYCFYLPPSTGQFIHHIISHKINLFLQKCGFGPLLEKCFWSDLIFMVIHWNLQQDTTPPPQKNHHKLKAQPKQRSPLNSSAYGVVVFLECITGRILVDGRTNIINIVHNNIYCCWSAMLSFHNLYLLHS